MNRAKSFFLKALLIAVPVGAALMVSAPTVAEAQEVILPVPSVVIASSHPEYYEGRPVYWYHSNWYYHNGHNWNYYHGEPAYLRDRRSHWGGNRGHYHYRR